MTSGHLPDGPPPQDAREVADGVFAFIQPHGGWWVNNAGFVVGDELTLIDTSSTQRRTVALQDAIRRVTQQRASLLVNTHHHGDHTNGNCLFPEAVVVGHTRCREEMLNQGIGGLDAIFGAVEWGDLSTRPPTVVFDDTLSIRAGVDIEVCHIGGPAHTVGDSFVWIPDRSVLFTGDLAFNRGTPFFLMGSLQGSLSALATLRALGAQTVIPGHGETCDATVFDAVESYLGWVQNLAAQARAAGLSPLQAALEADLGPWEDLLHPERLAGNLHRAYAELEGEAPGAPVDIGAAFADMIAFNGGRPLDCWA